MADADAASAARDRTTPLGRPVDPDVATIRAASGSATGTSGRNIATVAASAAGATTEPPARASDSGPHSSPGSTTVMRTGKD